MKSLITTLFLSVFIIGASFAQNDRIDSLKQEIEKHSTSKNEDKRIETITALATAYYKSRDYKMFVEIVESSLKNLSNGINEEVKNKFIFVSARGFLSKYQREQDLNAVSRASELFEKVIPLLKKENAEESLAIALSEYGLCLLIKQREDKAISAFERSLSIFERRGIPNNDWTRCLTNLSNTYSNSGNYEMALKYLRASKDLATKLNDEVSLTITDINMGLIFLSLKDYDKALKNFNEALNNAKKIELPFFIANAYLQIGTTELQLDKPADWEKGKINLDKSIELFTTLKDDYSLADAQKRIGIYYGKKKDYKKALLANNNYLNFFEKRNDLEIMADAYALKGDYLYQFNELDSAENSLKKSILLSKKIENKKLTEETYAVLIDVAEKKQNYKNALYYARQFNIYRDSIYSENLGNVVGKESVTQDVEGAEQAQKEAELEAKVLAGRNQLYLAIALGLLGIILIGGYLYQQLRKTRKQLENQNTQLTQLNDTKDRFFGIIAHDIRGPITSLDGVGEQMSYYLKKNNTERVNKLTTQIDNTSKKLTNLLDNLLNWALLQKGTIPYHPKSLDIHEVVQENIDLYTEVADMKNIRLTNKVANGTLAFADMSAITTIIRNLINNAVKFTPDDGEISISTAVENDKVLIEINDTGTGISAERLNKIFELNTERKKGTAGEKGSGLGLLLCKDLVELNKGTIRAISELGKGSTFIFSLPTS